MQPDAVVRFVSRDFELLRPSLEPQVDEEFWRQVPRETNLFGDHVSLVRVKASDEFLVPMLERLGRSTPKKDLYLLASTMTDTEIHPEVAEKLDRIAEALGLRRGDSPA